MRLDVYVNGKRTGVLEASGVASFIFTYLPEATHAVSLTMPIRTASYEAPFLHPIFQVSLPEGDLRKEIEKTLMKRMDAYGDIAILSVIGSSLVGRVQVVPYGETAPTESSNTTDMLSSVLTHGASRKMMTEFISRHAESSGVSGGFLKVLSTQAGGGRYAVGPVGRWIVKFSDTDHPYLSLNEYHSMSVARRVGLPVPKMHLSDDVQVLLVERFDAQKNGERIGFEDMCSLMALPSGQKFSGSVEGIIKTINLFSHQQHINSSLYLFFKQYACAVMIRNGDAHLKNFGLLYTSKEDARLSPCYDMVTMSAYAHFLPNGKVDDMMALTLSGTKQWPDVDQLKMMASRCKISEADCKKILHEISVSINETAIDVHASIVDHPDFKKVGNRMLGLWADGVSSLGMNVSFSYDSSFIKKPQPPR